MSAYGRKRTFRPDDIEQKRQLRHVILEGSVKTDASSHSSGREGRPRNLWCACAAAALILASVSGYAQNNLGYDPQADPFQQLQDAQATAADDGKLILVIAGGEWCIWCHWLDAYLAANVDISEALKETFVVLKIFFGGMGYNEEFFATMPRATGYPHFWVLNSEGTLLVSQNTVPLEDGDKSYDKRNFMAFIDEWRATL